jgi:hypothetical protein
MKIEDVKVINMELQPDHKLLVCMFVEVSNAAELRAAVLKQSYDAAFINAQMVVI